MEREFSSKWKYIDIHSHIIPGVDDGAENFEESMDMIETAYQEGIRVMIATPHYGKWNPDYNKEYAIGRFRELCSRVKVVHPDMKLFFGNEIYYGTGVVDDLRNGRAMTLGGTDYALVEFSPEAEYQKIYDGLREFINAGYRPVLAHAERYRCLRNDLKGMKAVIDMGVCIQINAGTFLGKLFGKQTSWAKRLLDERMVHFIASDCHNAGSRKPVMKTAVEEMMRVAWDDIVEDVVYTNIVKLVKNELI